VSLRARLTIAFVLVLALPLIAVMLLVRGAVGGEVRERAAARLRTTQTSAPVLYRSWQSRASDLVRGAADRLARPDAAGAFTDPVAARRFADGARGSLDILAVRSATGAVLGASSASPSFLSRATPPPADQLVRNASPGWVVLAEVVVSAQRGPSGSLVGGFWLDRSFTGELPAQGPRALVLVDGMAVASNDPSIRSAFRPAFRHDGPLLAATFGTASAGYAVVAVDGPLVQGIPASHLSVVAYEGRSTALGRADSLGGALLIVVVVALLLGAGVAWMLARIITRPLTDMSNAASAIARGGVAGSIDASSPDEVGRLATAFNEVLGTMQERVSDLQDSRDQVRRSVERLGEVLRSTHDLSKLLSVVLETAISAVSARAGAVWLIAPSRTELAMRVSRGLDPSAGEVRPAIGEGIAGAVARTRRALLIPSAVEAPAPAPWEPREPTVIAVPIESENQLLGVIVLYGRTLPQPFDAVDLDTVRSLARQAAVGVENVLLHQEAQRLSITDGLTSLWNYRYMNMRLAQEVERAIRFNRALSVLVIDIDHFKQVNDQYGHQRGDAILAELANRVVSETRGQVDTAARYGGEEFVLILPETPLDGATVVAEKVRERIGETPFGGEGEEPITVTVSIGIAVFPEHGAKPQTLLRAADQALYEAKGRGRDRVVTADELDKAPPVADDPERP
jgi:two-component system, cell cycle response regulator